MTQYRLWVIAIAAAIIVPLLVGFCWPSDDTSEPIWTADDRYIDLYSTLATTDVPNTTQYSGANNNMFLFDTDSYGGGYDVAGNGYTASETPYPYYNVANDLSVTSAELPYGVHTSTDTDTMYGVGASIDPSPDSATMYVFDGRTSLKFIDEDGTEYRFLMIYANGRTVLMNMSTGAMMDTTNTTFYYTFQSAGLTPTVTPCRATGYYIDVSKGFYAHSSGDRLAWMNGYDDHGITMLVHKSQYNGWDYQGANFFFEGANGESWLRVYNDNSTLNVKFEYNGVSKVYPLGDVNTYDYVLVIGDADTKSLVVYGLLGMDNFATNYIDRLGNSVRFDNFEQGTFDLIEMVGEFEYYVASTTVVSGTAKAMVNATLTPKDYYGDQNWMTILRAPAVLGDSLTFGTLGGTTHTYTLDAGYIELPIGKNGDNVETSVRELRVEHLLEDDNAYHTYVNGVEMPYNIDYIIFDGTWVLGLPTYHMTLEQHTEYQWTVGQFNLDYKGFCMVGMLTMVLMFILFGMMYHRTEGDTGVSGMVASAAIGILYLILLMSNY